MASKLLRPDILPLFLVLLLCVSAAALLLYFEPPRTCEREVLLCGFYNTTPSGAPIFHPGCVKVCNDSDNSIWLNGYVSGSKTFMRK